MSEDFGKWFKKVSEASKKTPPPPLWVGWPQEALDEIKNVLEFNDTHPSRGIARKVMLQRLNDEYELQTTKHTLCRYVREGLHRTGWKNP